jgi:2-hydroxychromene-2-carboxylate isomerase
MNPVCLVMGAGAGIGGNVGKRFAKAGYHAYLVHKAIPSITDKTGIEFEYLPVLLGGVFKATNNVSPDHARGCICARPGLRP